MRRRGRYPHAFLLRMNYEQRERLWDIAAKWRLGRCAALRRALLSFDWTALGPVPRRGRFPYHFLLTMDRECRQRLADLARQHRATKSTILREAILAAWVGADPARPS